MEDVPMGNTIVIQDSVMDSHVENAKEKTSVIVFVVAVVNTLWQNCVENARLNTKNTEEPTIAMCATSLFVVGSAIVMVLILVMFAARIFVTTVNHGLTGKKIAIGEELITYDIVTHRRWYQPVVNMNFVVTHVQKSVRRVVILFVHAVRKLKSTHVAIGLHVAIFVKI